METTENTGTQTPPSLPTRAKRRRFTNSERLAMVRNIKRRVATGAESIRKACRELNIIPKQYREWTKSIKTMSECNPRAKSSFPGPKSILEPVEKDLLSFIFELREQGMAVYIPMVSIKASTLMRSFREKTREARYHSVSRWIKHHSIVHRMGTHESQKAPSETAKLAEDYMEIVRPLVSQANRSQDYILNMDQTPVPFTFNAKRTLEIVGRHTVHIRKSTCDTKRVTCALTVTASGRVLTPLLVFKGVPGGRIEKREFITFPNDIVYACQGNAWMDEKVMLLWVDKILKPYVETAPDGIVPLMFLDSYRCHMMGSVVQAIQDLGVEVEHIPGGCTYVCQPVDVGVNKPLKARLRNLWEAWMISDGLLTGTTKPPTRADIAEWCSEVYKGLTDSMVRNAWRHGAYTFFPPTAQPRPTDHA